MFTVDIAYVGRPAPEVKMMSPQRLFSLPIASFV
jgi:hypothetical protein